MDFPLVHREIADFHKSFRLSSLETFEASSRPHNVMASRQEINAAGFRKSLRNMGFLRERATGYALMNPPADRDVIFLDYNGLDCRKNNLAIVDKVEARRHHRVRKDCYTGIKGVTFDPEFQTWGAVFVPKGKVTVIGAFDTVEEATAAYDQAVKRNYGPLAPLHQPVDKHSSAKRTPPPYVPPPQRRSRSKKMEAVEVES